MFQRPQHLLTRCARDRRVFYLEEPIVQPETQPSLEQRTRGSVTVVVPHLPESAPENERERLLREMLDRLLRQHDVNDYVLWYYTPMALSFTDHLTPAAVVYDCMDELSAFKGAPALLKDREAALIRRASLVLTGGQSLYEAKRSRHHNIHAVPSSVDVSHFAQARTIMTAPADQAAVPGPRLGFFGVIDERMDLDLLRGVAEARPDWQLMMLGPVVKIDPTTLPTGPNIHYLGAKKYDELPAYIAGWDVALLPFARNEATRFISPTKTPEYMAAGKPVVSTSIRDVVKPYGQRGLARIADTVSEFVAACDAAMAEQRETRLVRHDAFLKLMSWDSTWARVEQLVNETFAPADEPPSTASAAAL